MAEPQRRFSVIAFRATGFTGFLVAKYLLEKMRSGVEAFTFAIAGRSLEKLEEVRRRLGPGAENVPIIIADSADQDSLP